MKEDSKFLTKSRKIITKFGWAATISSVNKDLFKHNQGVNVVRHYDGSEFSISPSDIEWFMVKESEL